MVIKMIRFIGISRSVFFHGEEPELNKDKHVKEFFLDKITDFLCRWKFVILAYSQAETFLSRAQLTARRGPFVRRPSLSAIYKFLPSAGLIRPRAGRKRTDRRPLLKKFERPSSEFILETNCGDSVLWELSASVWRPSPTKDGRPRPATLVLDLNLF